MMPTGELRIRISAPAVGGKANRELLRFLAGTLGIPQGDVRLMSGEHSRRKIVAIHGLDTTAVRVRLFGGSSPRP